jgi:hypothetical protein
MAALLFCVLRLSAKRLLAVNGIMIGINHDDGDDLVSNWRQTGTRPALTPKFKAQI